ncbi:MAG: hypothetical protein RJA70_963 [Pseudomonadota bacterium]|jgi:galactokinase
MVDLQQLRREFVLTYDGQPRTFSAPGRVNLIGEHTDYNDGFVLPIAIDRRTVVTATPRTDRLVRVKSKTIEGSYEFDLDAPSQGQRGLWIDYVEGTAQALIGSGFQLRGLDLLIDSDVPAGAGLSASAALEMSVGFAFAVLGGKPDPDKVKLALAGQTAEHKYVGTLCGIMDQYICALGREDHALLIDCRTLQPKFVPLELKGAQIVVCDTRVKHQLASSEYNQRREECEKGVQLLGKHLPGLTSLRDVSRSDFERFESELPEPVRSRCRHVVTENERTLAAAAALADGDLGLFGTLMRASHESLRKDYEVSCKELDAVVDASLGLPGVYGARMTGGGFGGCVIALVESDSIPSVSAALNRDFAERFGHELSIFATRACAGVSEDTAL